MSRDRCPLRILAAAVLSLPMFTSGCAAKRGKPLVPPPHAGPTGVAERLVARNASITVRVKAVAIAAGQVEGIVGRVEGIVVESTRSDDGRAWFTLRVPSGRLDEVLDGLSGLGRATERRVTARDVTDETFDVDARLQNKRALRDRLRGHLASTVTLQEVLLLEEQLGRLQTDIDTLEGQLHRLQSSVAQAQVSLSLERERRLGPLGYLLRGLWFGLSRLFVWG